MSGTWVSARYYPWSSYIVHHLFCFSEDRRNQIKEIKWEVSLGNWVGSATWNKFHTIIESVGLTLQRWALLLHRFFSIHCITKWLFLCLYLWFKSGSTDVMSWPHICRWSQSLLRGCLIWFWQRCEDFSHGSQRSAAVAGSGMPWVLQVLL